MVREMIRLGHWEAAIGSWLAEDCYLRESEWIQLQARDIHIHNGVVALTLGNQERRESTKTPGPQGVIVENAVLATVMMGLKAETHTDSQVFTIDQVIYRRA